MNFISWGIYAYIRYISSYLLVKTLTLKNLKANKRKIKLIKKFVVLKSILKSLIKIGFKYECLIPRIEK